ncbi:hypothetical protein DFJ74DRAFT_714480 [Hyaloraphidium curvatum]|nr:hypothetical protein DFJ74DRAFT_714480 [Hyaloraphidium curvatum]
MGAPILGRVIEPSTLTDDPAMSPAKLQARLRQARRMKPRGPPRPVAPRDDSLADDAIESWYVSRTAQPRWKTEKETGYLRIAVDNNALKAAAEAPAVVRVAPAMSPTKVAHADQPPIGTSLRIPDKRNPDDEPDPPPDGVREANRTPSPTPELLPLEELVAIAERVLERHSVELETPTPKEKYLGNLYSKRTRRSPLRNAHLPESDASPVVRVMQDRTPQPTEPSSPGEPPPPDDFPPVRPRFPSTLGRRLASRELRRRSIAELAGLARSPGAEAELGAALDRLSLTNPRSGHVRRGSDGRIAKRDADERIPVGRRTSSAAELTLGGAVRRASSGEVLLFSWSFAGRED